MKKNKYIIPVIAVLIMTFSGCKKEFFTDVNTNPNAPASVPPAYLLSTVEGALAYSQGGDMSRFSSLLTQQTNGVSRQAAAYYEYIFTGQDVDNLWGLLYTSTMENCKSMIDTCDAKGYNAYGGIGRILFAYSLQITVDCWGKIPYSQAFQGASNLQPVFDNDAALYATITGLVNDGITKLTNTDPGVLIPGGEDVVYAGDASKWIAFGHAILARLAIHQAKSNTSFSQTALNEIALSFGDNSGNAQYAFGSTEISANPWYQFNEQRGDVSFSTSTLADSMIAKMDPRYPVLIDSANDPDGFGLNAYYGSISAPVEFICYDELQFMKAEALIRVSNDVAGAQTAFQAGITANMTKLGVAAADIATYIASYGTLDAGGGAAAITQIATEEYYALYLNPEAWTVYRRTGSPAISPVTGMAVPRRLLYPQTEYSYNGSNTPSSTLYAPRVFWDGQ